MVETKEFLLECLGYKSGEEAYLSGYKYLTGHAKAENVSFDDFFQGQRAQILKRLWAFTFDIGKSHPEVNKYSSQTYHYCKMSITKYIAVELDKIGKDKTFYFLGKRFTKVGDVNKIAEHFGWTWEKSDPSKADFFILGDNPTGEEASYNRELNKPVVMDDELRVQLHFLFDPEVSIEEVNQEMIASYLDQTNLDHLKMMCCIIKYLKPGVLSDLNRYRLIRCYVNTYHRLDRDFDLSDKDDVMMSDTVQKYCFPQHRYLVTKHYLSHSKRRSDYWMTSSQSESLGKASVWSSISRMPIGTNPSHWIHTSPECDNLVIEDMENENQYSVVSKVTYNTNSHYSSLIEECIVIGSLYRLGLRYPSSRLQIFCKLNGDKLEFIDCKFNSTSSELTDSVPSKLTRKIVRDMKTSLIDISTRLLNSISVTRDSDPNDSERFITSFKCDYKERNKLAIELEELCFSHRIYDNSIEELIDNKTLKSRIKAALAY